MTRQARFSVFGLILALMLPVLTRAAEPKLITAFFVKGKVGLKWQKLDGVTEYIVYRKSNADFAKISSTDEDHYFDTDIVPGTTYAYKIAIMEGGAEVFSSEKSVTIPGEVGGFKPPTWVGVRVERERIMLNWDPVPSAVAYNIYRSTTSGEGYEIVGNTQGSRYADRADLVKGQTYYYVLSALNAEFEDTDYSEERSIQFGVSREEEEALIAKANEIVLEPVALKQLFKISDAGPAGDMNQPADIFLNSKGDIYVTDVLNYRVHCFDSKGGYHHSFGEKARKDDAGDYEDGGFLFPFTLFIDKTDQVYVCDLERHDIQVFEPDGKFIRRIQVNAGEGNEPFKPTGLHVLDDGRLVVADSNNHRFLITDGNGKVELAVGTRGEKPGQFNFPDELIVTDAGEICVVDVINCRVQVFNMKGEFLRSFGEIGQTAGTFGRPKGIAVDERHGRIWVSDAMGNLVQAFTPEGVIKSALGTSEDEWAFFSPRGLFFRDERFYVVNRLHNEVIVFSIG